MIDDQSPKIKPTRRRGLPRSNPAQRPSSTGPVNGHPSRSARRPGGFCVRGSTPASIISHLGASDDATTRLDVLRDGALGR